MQTSLYLESEVLLLFLTIYVYSPCMYSPDTHVHVCVFVQTHVYVLLLAYAHLFLQTFAHV